MLLYNFQFRFWKLIGGNMVFYLFLQICLVLIMIFQPIVSMNESDKALTKVERIPKHFTFSEDDINKDKERCNKQNQQKIYDALMRNNLALFNRAVKQTHNEIVINNNERRRTDLINAVRDFVEKETPSSNEVSPLRKSRKLDDLTLIADRA